MLFILSQAFIDAYRIRVADESGVQKRRLRVSLIIKTERLYLIMQEGQQSEFLRRL